MLGTANISMHILRGLPMPFSKEYVFLQTRKSHMFCIIVEFEGSFHD